MMRFNNNFGDNNDQCASDSRYYLNNLSYEDDPVEIFLNDDAFLSKIQQNKQTESSFEHSNTLDPQASPRTSQAKETHQPAKRKSIFHNFQKHLITLIKKFIKLPAVGDKCGDGDSLASELWGAFMKTRSFNKKILHMAFGVLQKSKIDQEFARLSSQFPEFKAICCKYSTQDVIQAQHLIRQRFVEHASRLSKEQLKADCGVSRFQEFYEYYQSFVRQVTTGPMTKRMTKSRKFGVVQRLGENAALK